MPPSSRFHCTENIQDAKIFIKAVQNDPHILGDLLHSRRKAAKLGTVVEEAEVLTDSVAHASIVGSKVFQSVTLYIIEIQRDGHSWTVERRFSDFLTLDSRLGEFPCALPEKGLFGFRKWLNIGRFRERRVNGLNEYIQHLVRQDIGMGPAFMYIDVFLGFTRHSCSFGKSKAKMLEALAATCDENTTEDADMTMVDLECSSFGK